MAAGQIDVAWNKSYSNKSSNNNWNGQSNWRSNSWSQKSSPAATGCIGNGKWDSQKQYQNQQWNGYQKNQRYSGQQGHPLPKPKRDEEEFAMSAWGVTERKEEKVEKVDVEEKPACPISISTMISPASRSTVDASSSQSSASASSSACRTPKSNGPVMFNIASDDEEEEIQEEVVELAPRNARKSIAQVEWERVVLQGSADLTEEALDCLSPLPSEVSLGDKSSTISFLTAQSPRGSVQSQGSSRVESLGKWADVAVDSDDESDDEF